MSVTIKSSHQDKKSIEARLVNLDKARQSPAKEYWKDISFSLFASLVGAVLSLFASAAVVSGSFRSILQSIKVRPTYVYFILGVLVFQLMVVFVIWLIRKRNREILEFKDHITDVYLSAINKSALNPNLKSSTSR